MTDIIPMVKMLSVVGVIPSRPRPVATSQFDANPSCEAGAVLAARLVW